MYQLNEQSHIRERKTLACEQAHLGAPREYNGVRATLAGAKR